MGKWQNAQENEKDKIAKYSNEIDSYIGGGRDYKINYYMTDEPIVGSWIDGKNIYQKYFTPYSTNIENIDKIVDIKIYFHTTNQQEIVNPCYVIGDFKCMGYYGNNSKSIEIIKSNDTTIDYLFVQYRKINLKNTNKIKFKFYNLDNVLSRFF